MSVKARNEIDNKFKWDLNAIIPGNDAWEQLFVEVQAEIKEAGKYAGTLSDNAKLLAFLRESDALEFKLEKLMLYAKMTFDQDTAVAESQEMYGRLDMLLVDYSAATSYVTPEICIRSREELLALAQDPDFSDYSYMLKELARKKERVLSDKEELIMSQVGMFAGDFRSAFVMFDNADVRFDEIKDESGKKVPVSHGLYGMYLQSPVRRVRRDAFASMFTAYERLNNTIASIYAGNVKKDIFYAKVRGFDSSLAYAMDSENVPANVYTNLLKAVESGLPALRRYINLRKKALGIRQLHCYDLYVPMVAEGNMKLSYEEAFSLVCEALRPMGEEYQQLLHNAHDNGWIDVYENKNKCSGAYSWGTWGLPHPYVLLNYTETTHDIFTIAHELGHAMHTHFSSANQPKAKSNYEIFVAEVASTVNEVLLLKYLLGKEEGEMKKYLLSYFLEMFRTTVFRQTMFAEFELQAHELVENGGAAVAGTLNDIYYKLNQKYYANVTLDDQIKYEWSRIPHFYRGYYVYKYSTGLLSAVNIAEGILAGDTAVIEGYKAFLRAGGSMPPHDILKLTGVDLTTPASMKRSMKVFKDTVEELAKYYK